MRANLRVLAGTVVLAFGAFLGIGAGQQPPPVAVPPPAPPTAIILNLGNGDENVGAVQFHLTTDMATDMSAVHQKIAAVPLDQFGTRPAPAELAVAQQKL